MRARKPPRPKLRLAVAALALVVGAGSGPLAAPAPARADTVRELQWYLDTLKIPQAHKITKGKGVTVAVIDSGVDASLPDLRGQILPGKGVGSATASDGRRDDDEKLAHGTAMAGIIASRGGGAMRCLGIAPEARILPVALGRPFDTRDVADGIRWAADAGADVINLSIGSDAQPTPEEVAAVRYALDKDVVLVSSAGNRKQGARGVGSPASIPGIIAVTGLAKDGGHFAESVGGPEAVLAAPMEKIISPRPKSVSSNGYGLGSGTSDAAAIMSGVAALVRAKYPDLDAANVVNRLIRTARDQGPAGRDSQYGFGAVDPLAALTRSVPAVDAHPLLAGATNGAAPSAPAATPSKDDGPAVSISMKNGTGALVQGALCLLVPIALLILVIVLVRRSRRKAATGPPGYPPSGGPQTGPPGFPPSGGPPPGSPGYPPPPGYPTPPGYPPSPGYPPPPGYAPLGGAPGRPSGNPQFGVPGHPPSGGAPTGSPAPPQAGPPAGYGPTPTGGPHPYGTPPAPQAGAWAPGAGPTAPPPPPASGGHQQ
ncbi:S8 family serine peptidase [Micromonospora peucetia]|uniref:S8 family serine peptidase n=1 Tax=Micromonospora peucetia TaxID=47871 RepID=UPI0022547B33|nr:S8 family serine peptidase [Micromonospora peucetia]MCX4387026.1 S8 family serine peptidase [Micromonospora peucetia]